jgi:hypothetical protein
MAWVVDAAATAFLEVGVLVAVLLALVGRLQHRSGDAVQGWLVRHRRLGPLVGALLGVLPGCGGALVVMPVYLRGTVSFGTVVATLVATMGDASFVLLATSPAIAIGVHVTLLVTGVGTGLLVDALRVAPARAATVQRLVPERLAVAGRVAPRPTARTADQPEAGIDAGIARHGPGVKLRSAGVLFWVLVVLGGALVLRRLLGVPIVEGAPPVAGTPGTVGPTLDVVVGVSGLLVCLALLVLGRARGTALGCTATAQPGEVLLAAAQETAIVVCWVAAAFVVVEVAVVTAGVDLAALPVLGVVGVLVGSGLGLVPGCGPQLVLTGLYVQGVVPLPMLLANALSQDGDALLPLLVLDRRAALLGTAVSTVPGVVVGSVLVGLGW